MKNFISKSQKIGKMGEDLASKFLMKHGFTILERNYTKKWGEIDIIAKRDNTIHFIEVKAVRRILNGQNVTKQASSTGTVTHETDEFFRPEENVHQWKKKRLARTIETFLIHNRIGNTPWQFDVLLVYIDLEAKRARVETLENIIL